MRTKGVLLGALALATLIAVSAAFATKPGNSPNAKSCQKNGWMSLYTRSGQAFSSAGECGSYAAHGGTLIVEAALAVPQRRLEDTRIEPDPTIHERTSLRRLRQRRRHACGSRRRSLGGEVGSTGSHA